jgi:hypothetical protein
MLPLPSSTAKLVHRNNPYPIFLCLLPLIMLVEIILANRPSSVVLYLCMRGTYQAGCDPKCQELGADPVYAQMEGCRVCGPVAPPQLDNESSLHVEDGRMLCNVSFVFHTSIYHQVSQRCVSKKADLTAAMCKS